MNQQEKGCIVKLGKCSIVEFCPVCSMQEFLAEKGVRQGKWFCHRDGTPLMKFQFWRVIFKALQKARIMGWKIGDPLFSNRGTINSCYNGL